MYFSSTRYVVGVRREVITCDAPCLKKRFEADHLSACVCLSAPCSINSSFLCRVPPPALSSCNYVHAPLLCRAVAAFVSCSD